MALIPPEEMVRFGETVAAAHQRAQEGYSTWGLVALAEGLLQAVQAEQRGEPWGKELRERWEQAEAQYLAIYPHTVERPDPPQSP